MLSVSTALLFAGVASAPVTQWEVPPECPDVAAVLTAAEEFGADVADASLRLDGRIEAVDGGYRLDLEIDTPSGTTTRRLHAASCDELTRAAGLVLSVAVDPLEVPEPPAVEEPAASEPPEEPSAVEPETEVLPTQPMGAADSPRPDSAATPVMRGSVVVAGTLGRGLSPAVDGRAQLGLALDTRWVRVELLGFHAFAQSVEYRDPPGVGATIHAWGGSVRAGPRGDVGGVELACPVGIETAAMVGAGFGVDQTWRRADLAWGVVAAPGVRFPLGNRVSIGVDGELSIAVRRPAFTVDLRESLYRIPRLGARAGARLEIQFFGPPRDQIRKRRRRR